MRHGCGTALSDARHNPQVANDAPVECRQRRSVSRTLMCRHRGLDRVEFDEHGPFKLTCLERKSSSRAREKPASAAFYRRSRKLRVSSQFLRIDDLPVAGNPVPFRHQIVLR